MGTFWSFECPLMYSDVNKQKEKSFQKLMSYREHRDYGESWRKFSGGFHFIYSY